MEYTKGKPYFCLTQDRIKQYKYLDKDIECDVLIIGGGIDGAIANYYLSNIFDTVLVEQGRLGFKCTPCATALLEYQLDDFAEDLLSEMTEREISDIYHAGIFAIEKMKNFIEKYGNKCEFAIKDTLVFSTKNKDKKAFENEYEFRKRYDLNAKLFYEEDNPFPFYMKVGLYCKEAGAECNPYLFEKQMIENSKNQSRIFENTNIAYIQRIGEKLVATTNYTNKIVCNKIIGATGFDFSLFTNADLCDKFVTYTIVTEPIPSLKWKNNALVQDYLDPYHYMRILPDNRLILGGEDTSFTDGPIDEKLAEKQYTKLVDCMKEMFPEYADAKIEYKFCGIFGSTENNLGMIGECEKKDIYHFFSCGANGIINAMFGIETLIDSMNKRPSKFTKLFSPIRLKIK